MDGKPSDDEITRVWGQALALSREPVGYRSVLDPEPQRRGPPLRVRIARSLVDDLERRGVTETDIERLGL